MVQGPWPAWEPSIAPPPSGQFSRACSTSPSFSKSGALEAQGEEELDLRECVGARQRTLSEVRELMGERLIGARPTVHMDGEGPDPGDRSDRPERLRELERPAERGRLGPNLGEAGQAQSVVVVMVACLPRTKEVHVIPLL
jgi:hypothetical protein